MLDVKSPAKDVFDIVLWVEEIYMSKMDVIKLER